MLKSVGMIIPNIWKNKKCSKPPTSHNIWTPRSATKPPMFTRSRPFSPADAIRQSLELGLGGGQFQAAKNGVSTCFQRPERGWINLSDF
jgi:hypothetical protein